MSPKIIRTAAIGAGFGTALGLALIVVPVAAYLVAMSSSQYAGMLLLPAFLGVFILFWGLVGLLGVKQLKKNRVGSGVALLFVSAIGGSLLGFSLIVWAIPALLEIGAAFSALQEIYKRNSLSNN